MSGAVAEGLPNTIPPGTKVRVVWEYQATREDEFSLEEDDVITVTYSPQGGWWRGENSDGRVGWFPANYTEPITNNNKDVLSTETATERYILARPDSVMILDQQQTGEGTIKSRNWYHHYRNRTSYTTASGLTVNRNSAVSFKAGTIGNSNPFIQGTSVPVNQASQTSTSQTNSIAVDPALSTNTFVIRQVSIAERTSEKDRLSSISSTSTSKKMNIVPPLPTTYIPPPPIVKKWIDKVDPSIIQNLSKEEIKRQEVIYELTNTEKDYVQDIELIIERFMDPIRKGNLITPKDFAVIFSNLEILLPVNQELLRCLEEKREKSPVVDSVGDVFLHVSDYFKMYTLYCSNHPYSLTKLQALQNKTLKLFLEEVYKSNTTRNMDLNAFLIKPIQRICKYPLLLREIIKNTPEMHPDYKNLQEALHKIETVVLIVNEGTRQAEAMHKMIEIQGRFTEKINILMPTRRFIKEETVSVVGEDGIHSRQLIIFNDMFLLAKYKKDRYATVDSMNKLELILITELNEANNYYIIITHSGKCKHKLLMHSLEAKTQLLTLLTKILEEANASYKANAALFHAAGGNPGDNSEGHVDVDDFNADTVRLKPQRTAAQNRPVSTLFMALQMEAEAQGQVVDPNSGPLPINIDILRENLMDSINTFQDEPIKSPLPEKQDDEEDETGKKKRMTWRPTKGTSKGTLKATRDEKTRSRGELDEVTVDSTEARKSTVMGKIRDSIQTLFLSESKKKNRDTRDFDVDVSDDTSRSEDSMGPSGRVRSKTADASLLSPKLSKDNLGFTLSPDDPALPKDIKRLSAPSLSRPTSVVPDVHITTSSDAVNLRNSETKLESMVQPGSSADSLTSSATTISGSQAKVFVPSAPLSSPKKNAGVLEAYDNARLSEMDSKRPQSAVPLLAPNVTVTAPVVSARVDGFFVLEGSKKDYFYAIEVIRQNSSFVILKSFDDFFELHMQLVAHYPEEAGLNNQERILPSLPPQRIYVSDAIAQSRMTELDAYVKTLLTCPAKVSKSPQVRKFFGEHGKLVLAIIADPTSRTKGPRPMIANRRL